MSPVTGTPDPARCGERTENGTSLLPSLVRPTACRLDGLEPAPPGAATAACPDSNGTAPRLPASTAVANAAFSFLHTVAPLFLGQLMHRQLAHWRGAAGHVASTATRWPGNDFP